ncbi:hypothetical protein GOODEAATRI_033499 [Goodea atripinnis]|uniref:Uncharacterized protein n=1 Tax=Goodea atripinnis TaxID=208336 RepID=A0ABV0N696_9TELE
MSPSHPINNSLVSSRSDGFRNPSFCPVPNRCHRHIADSFSITINHQRARVRRHTPFILKRVIPEREKVHWHNQVAVHNLPLPCGSILQLKCVTRVILVNNCIDNTLAAICKFSFATPLFVGQKDAVTNLQRGSPNFPVVEICVALQLSTCRLLCNVHSLLEVFPSCQNISIIIRDVMMVNDRAKDYINWESRHPAKHQQKWRIASRLVHSAVVCKREGFQCIRPPLLSSWG